MGLQREARRGAWRGVCGAGRVRGAAGEQAEQLRVCTGGSGILRVCCFSFLTQRLALASVRPPHSWDLVGDTRSGLRRSKPPRPAGRGHSSPQLPGSPRRPDLAWVLQNQVQKFKNEGTRPRPSPSLIA